MEMEPITREWLDEVLKAVDINTNSYSNVRLPLDRDQRARIIGVLLPKLIERTAKAKVLGWRIEASNVE